jgi:hypothetical protein
MENEVEIMSAIQKVIDTLVPGYTDTMAQRLALMAIVRGCVESEREACAQIADNIWARGIKEPYPAQMIAERIRARGHGT